MNDIEKLRDALRKIAAIAADAAGELAPVNVSVNGFDIICSETSAGAKSWHWTVRHPTLGEVKRSYEQNPTFSVTTEGPAEYTVELTIDGLANPTVNTVRVDAPQGRDDVAWGEPTFREKGLTDVSLSIPINRLKSAAGATLSAPTQVSLTILADGRAVYGPARKRIGDSLREPHEALRPSGVLREGGSLDFESAGDSVKKYTVRLKTETGSATENSHDLTFHNPQHMLMRTNSGGMGVGHGLDQVKKNVPAIWSKADVEKYGIVGGQWLQQLAMDDDQERLDAIVNNQPEYPHLFEVSLGRWDIGLMGRVIPDNPQNVWGAPNFPHWTVEMGAQPRPPYRPWFDGTANDMATTLANLGYSQDPINKSRSVDANGNSLITCPARIGLDPAKKTWYVRTNLMNLGNDDYLKLVAHHYVAWRAFTKQAGYHISPLKIQFQGETKPPNFNIFADWVDNNANPGWNVRTDSGGRPGKESWGDRAQYAWSTVNVLDTVQASWKMTRLLASLDPTAILIYSPIFTHVGFSRPRQADFERDYPGSPQQAKAAFAEAQIEMATIASYLFPRESEVRNYGMDYLPQSVRLQLRKLTRDNGVVIYPKHPQDTIA